MMQKTTAQRRDIICKNPMIRITLNANSSQYYLSEKTLWNVPVICINTDGIIIVTFMEYDPSKC